MNMETADQGRCHTEGRKNMGLKLGAAEGRNRQTKRLGC
jgi:hypothetical protein